MATRLPTDKLVDRATLRKVADSRLLEAEALFEKGHYAGAVYLAGYAIECELKAAICRALDWEELRPIFAVHDLEGLLLHSGLARKIQEDKPAWESFLRIKEVWTVVGKQNIRYADPAKITREGAEQFLHQVTDEKGGVVPWVRGLT